jgi:hypothetical protein
MGTTTEVRRHRTPKALTFIGILGFGLGLLIAPAVSIFIVSFRIWWLFGPGLLLAMFAMHTLPFLIFELVFGKKSQTQSAPAVSATRFQLYSWRGPVIFTLCILVGCAIRLAWRHNLREVAF